MLMAEPNGLPRAAREKVRSVQSAATCLLTGMLDVMHKLMLSLFAVEQVL